MAKTKSRADNPMVPKDLPGGATEPVRIEDPLLPGFETLSIEQLESLEQLEEREASLIQTQVAFQAALRKIDRLEGFVKLARDILTDVGQGLDQACGELLVVRGRVYGSLAKLLDNSIDDLANANSEAERNRNNVTGIPSGG